ncbi:MAG: ABC transporter substrate-binding protein [Synergistaceae bacterium]|nr:ABC transporter substrate-binding protein [Synergistaceae bacterium]MBQ4419159.1 ABC transporter substrate-binding protein [Synergistaceae bacterium]MBQ7569532.1 ABC transporter substrate-binding protein [Synergistaceae bacterium]MBQ9897364.1 ABC transporter substrate-binding protein [Synergistaceae bacterium]MBR0220346.1 ABC transporter substrate-binding protein [Synergistaceae bacterium]
MRKLLALVLAAMLVMSAACAFAAETFKIGGTGPLTGGAAIYGNAAKNGAQLAVDEINAANGYVKFDLRYEDDTHDAEKAVNAYNALKDWGMQVSLSSVTSKPAEATAAENFADRIFGLTPSASAAAVTAGKDNVFQMCFVDPNQGSASAQYIADKKLAKKVAVIWKNDDVYSKGIYDTFVVKAKELGLEVVSDMTFADGNDTDFSVQLKDAQDKGAELVFLPMYYQPASLIFAQAAAMDYAPKWFGVDGMDGILTMEGFDKALAEGVILLTPFNADAKDEKTQKFVAEYQKRHGEVPNQFAADGYDCVYAFAQALENSKAKGSMNAEELCKLMIEQFTTMTFDGLTGANMTWSKNGEVTKDPKGMVIKNGAYVGLD